MPLRKLRVGMRGPDVKAVQEALNVWGAEPRLDPDGKFGPKTDTAVRKFQKAHGLQPVDGIVGRDTRGPLFPVGVATTTIYAMRLRMPEFPLAAALLRRCQGLSPWTHLPAPSPNRFMN